MEELAGLMGLSLVLVVFLVMIAFALIVGVYIYHALAWRTIARKKKHPKPWLAWIPFANVAMILQLGNFHWAWIFLILVPVLGWVALFVLVIIANWRIFEKRKYPGWFSLSSIIPKIGSVLYLIVIGFVAWKDRKKRLQL